MPSEQEREEVHMQMVMEQSEREAKQKAAKRGWIDQGQVQDPAQNNDGREDTRKNIVEDTSSAEEDDREAGNGGGGGGGGGGDWLETLEPTEEDDEEELAEAAGAAEVRARSSAIRSRRFRSPAYAPSLSPYEPPR